MSITLNRRSFICSAAVAGAALAATAGTALADAPASAGPAPDGATPPAEGDMPGGGMDPGMMFQKGGMAVGDQSYVPGPGEYPLGVPDGTPADLDWMRIPELVTSVDEEIDADVVVVGAGIAGVAAARAAAEAGARVVVLEALDAVQARGMDCGCFNSTVAKEAGLEADEDFLNQACLDMQRYTGNRANQAIMRTWIHRCGDDFDWWYEELLRPMGITIDIARWPLAEGYDPHDGEWFPQYISAHEMAAPEGMETGFMGAFPVAVQALADAAAEHGAQFFFNTRASQLVRGSDNKTGRVNGVIATDADGRTLRVNAARGVVLATGDYGHNRAMMQAWCPSQAELATNKSVYGSTANQGDGHLMGLWAGGLMQAIPHPHMAHGDPFASLGGFPSLFVDIYGRRFTNEDIPGQTFANTASELPQKQWWALCDAQYPNQLPLVQPGHGAKMAYDGDLDAWNAAVETGDRDTIEAMLAAEGNTIEHAWTIDELAEKIHMDPVILNETVARYNELAEAGYDADFGKQPKRLWPLSTPPFFYETNNWNFLVVTGGLRTTTKAEVIDSWGYPIPGLYAAGNVQGGRFGVDYPTIIPGISHSMCLTYGRIAGTEAAASDLDVDENPSPWRQWKIEEAAGKAAETEAAGSASYADGAYEASSKGIGGDVPVTVTIEGGRIAAVEVGENSETQGIGSKAVEQLPEAVVAANGTTGVDAVSGATITSGAIFSAVEECLSQAAL